MVSWSHNLGWVCQISGTERTHTYILNTNGADKKQVDIFQVKTWVYLIASENWSLFPFMKSVINLKHYETIRTLGRDMKIQFLFHYNSPLLVLFLSINLIHSRNRSRNLKIYLSHTTLFIKSVSFVLFHENWGFFSIHWTRGRFPDLISSILDQSLQRMKPLFPSVHRVPKILAPSLTPDLP